MKKLPLIFLMALTVSVSAVFSQSETPYGAPVRSVKLYHLGDQASFPAIPLNSNNALQLDFDDLDNRVKNYYYTFELCNADWTPSLLHPFEYIRGFQNNRITTYRNSSIATTQYVHYQAAIPDRNCYPSQSGNYLLKVFLDNDTTKLAFARRFIVYDNMAIVTAQVQQPFNAQYFRSYQKLFITLQTDSRIQVFTPGDLKVVVLQNNNWQTSLFMDRPTISRGNYYEYSDESLTALPAGKEFRWVDLRSLRLLSDRIQRMETLHDTGQVYLRPDPSRSTQPYVYYRDLNGSYTIESLESINPFWQGDYALVHFSYFPPADKAIQGNDVYLFGELTNYTAGGEGRMTFNKETGAYEKTLFLKQGYYSYAYVTKPLNGQGYPDFSQTEGNYWGTENAYTVLVYYRPFGARADQLIGFASLNSAFQRTGF
ncbi:MAG: type IX secretion system plug protein [Flavisolibacter sp.]